MIKDRKCGPKLVLDRFNMKINYKGTIQIGVHDVHQYLVTRIGGVMVRVLASSAVDRGFEPWSDKT